MRALKKRVSKRTAEWIINNTLILTIGVKPGASMSIASKVLNISKLDILKFIYSDKLSPNLISLRKHYLVSFLFPFGLIYNQKEVKDSLEEFKNHLLFILMTSDGAPSRFEISQFFNMRLSELLELEKKERKLVFDTLKGQVIEIMKATKYSGNDIEKVIKLTNDEERQYNITHISDDDILYHKKSSGILNEADVLKIKKEALSALITVANKIDMSYDELLSASQEILVDADEELIDLVFIEESKKNEQNKK